MSAGGVTKTFMFRSGPVLLFPAFPALSQPGNKNHSWFTITDDLGVTNTFEFSYDNTVLIPGAIMIDMSQYIKNGGTGKASAVEVARAAITAINSAGFRTQAALGDDNTYGQSPQTSIWARVSLIRDNENLNPDPGTAVLAVEGTNLPPADPNIVVIPFEETYNDAIFLPIETATPNPPVGADIARGYPWAPTFAGQIEAYVQAALPQVRVGIGPVGANLNPYRITFYGAVNEEFSPSPASGLVTDHADVGGGNPNNDFTVTALNPGDQYNGVQVNIVNITPLPGGVPQVRFSPGPNGVGGTLTIDVNVTQTTANEVIAAIKNDPTVGLLFTAALSPTYDVGNNGFGIVQDVGIRAILNGGITQGVLSWTDPYNTTTPPPANPLPAADVQTEPVVWTHSLGVTHNGTQYSSETGLQNPLVAQEDVPFDASDSAESLAQEIAAEINKAQTDFPLFHVSALAAGGQVELTNTDQDVAPIADPPLSVSGAGPGGNITGLAWLNGHLFGVSDEGGVYEAMNPQTPEFKTKPDISNPNAPQTTPLEMQPSGLANAFFSRYIGMIAPDADAADNGATFTGLTAGPPDVNGGEYANMLFATTAQGRLYALEFNAGYTAVSKQPIFLNGGTSISLGVTDITGLAFTTLDYNLWHVTNQQGSRRGARHDHDLRQPPRGGRQHPGRRHQLLVRTGEPQRRRLSPQPQAANYAITNPAVYNTYNLPDGAAGSLQTQTFDLSTYTAADAPTLYFNYFLNTAGPNGPPHDSARVYASSDGSNWTELANLSDSGGQWLQGVYSLAGFAGQANVRLRFDFSTAGDMEIGDANGGLDAMQDVLGNTDTGATTANYGGAYLTALPGDQINDGDTYICDGQTFEFDMGEALMVPNVAGDSLKGSNGVKKGDYFTVMSGANGTATQTKLATFEFTTTGTLPAGDTDTPIKIYLGETTSEVALAIAQAVNNAGLKNSLLDPITADVYQDRVMLDYAEGIALSAGTTLTTKGAGFGYAFVPNVANVPTPTPLAKTQIVPVRITSNMTADQVALAIATAQDQVYSAGRILQAVSAIPPIANGSSFSLTDGNANTVQFILEHDRRRTCRPRRAARQARITSSTVR